METRPLGRSGVWVGRLALGTATWTQGTDEYDARDQLAAFLDAGGSLIDSADVYAEGGAEALLGELIEEFEVRDDVVLATKSGGVSGPGRRINTSRLHLMRALEGSLTRLRTEAIDLWTIQAWDPWTPMEETLAAADAAVASGKVRYVAIANFSGWQTSRAATFQQASGAGAARAPIVATQMEYSLLERGIEREIVPAAQTLGLGILPWSPLGRGVLTGKYRHSLPLDSRGANPDTAGFVQAYLDERGRRIVDAVSTAAEGLGASPAEVALAWLRDRPGVVAPILGARTVKQLVAALASEELELPDEILIALDDVSAPAMGYPEAGWAQRR
ncbi:MAG: aldo/keto reductase [Candidatus Nanopelagicales bacterium]|jgi:aryl-alcohol dehydrogenase-like predicted oxidoreductase|nr:aldo/keto reductase [Candidatus Nanopelagicales bacterium]MCF8543587.1 aldo/keto reductase [Candidatus Nanopelagicales bacterium]MCF8556401.1 aldo/keto reductase [Candidatus Nanopelagicales bacterium]